MKAYLKVGVETGVGGECDRIRFESNGQEFQIKEDPIRNGLVIQSDEPLELVLIASNSFVFRYRERNEIRIADLEELVERLDAGEKI
jgi:hypothetical protein